MRLGLPGRREGAEKLALLATGVAPMVAACPSQIIFSARSRLPSRAQPDLSIYPEVYHRDPSDEALLVEPYGLDHQPVALRWGDSV